MPCPLRTQDMRDLTDQARFPGCHLKLASAAILAAAVLWAAAAPGAAAKGPIPFKLCGEAGCVKRSSPRTTAAMLYGGRHHPGPVCRARVHRVRAFMPGTTRDRRYLIVAARGLIGEQGSRGYVWWRKIRGHRKDDLRRAVRSTGRGFRAEPSLDLSITGFRAAPRSYRWRLRSDRITCTGGRD